MAIARTAPLTIGTCCAEAGSVTRGLLPAGTTAAGQPVFCPVVIAQGVQAGPAVLLTAALHGDELMGVEVIRRLLAELDLTHFRGSIVAIPVANPPAFRRGQRTVPEDAGDLNRAFPGSREGTLAAQIAWHLFQQVLPLVDYALDLHDAGAHNLLWPHVRLPAGAARGVQALALATGFEVLVERQGSVGMFAIEAGRLLDLPVLTLELGGGLHLDQALLETGVQGIRNLLASLGCLPQEPARPAVQCLFREPHGIPAPLAGLLHYAQPLGAALPAGALLATISDPFTGREEQVCTSQAGMLFSRRAAARANEGDSLGSLLAFQTDPVWGASPVDGQLVDNRAHPGPLTPARIVPAMAALLSPELGRLAAE